MPLESDGKQALGNQVSGAHLICKETCHRSLAGSESGKGTKRQGWQCRGQSLGVCLLVLGTAPTPSSHLPETGLPAWQGPLISHLLYIFLWSAETTSPTGESTGERCTIKVLETQEHLAWSDFFFKTTGEIWKLVQNGNSGKRDIISLWSQKKTLGPVEFPAFWCAPNWVRRRFQRMKFQVWTWAVKCPAVPMIMVAAFVGKGQKVIPECSDL